MYLFLEFFCIILQILVCRSVGQQKRADHAELDHVRAEAGEQGETDQPSGGQRVARPKLQQPVSERFFGKKSNK